MEFSEQDLREIDAARAFGERRMRLWMVATFWSVVVAWTFLGILLYSGVVDLDPMSHSLRRWVLFSPFAAGILSGLGFKKWYTPVLASKIAHEYDVTEESLELATIDVTGDTGGSGPWIPGP